MPCCSCRCQAHRACVRCSCVSADRRCVDCCPCRNSPSTCSNPRNALPASLAAIGPAVNGGTSSQPCLTRDGDPPQPSPEGVTSAATLVPFVGEGHRRIICRAIAAVLEADVMKVVAPTQTCVGLPSACETSVHIMSSLLQKPGVEGILLVDASNAFNSLNRAAALQNIPRVCPALAGVISNTYSHPIRLFVAGGGEIASV